MTRIGIIGLGYVGLPLAVACAEAGDDANARLVVDLRNAVRQTLNGSPSGAALANVTVL